MQKSKRGWNEGDVELVGGDIVFGSDVGPYRIDLRRCSSRRQIAEQVAHLSTKYWASADMIDRFVRLAVAHHKLTDGEGG